MPVLMDGYGKWFVPSNESVGKCLAFRFSTKIFGIVIIVQHNLCGTYNFSKLIETRQEGGSTIFDPQ